MKEKIDQGPIADVEIETLKQENLEVRKQLDENVLAKRYKYIAQLNIQLLDNMELREKIDDNAWAKSYKDMAKLKTQLLDNCEEI